MRSLFGRIIPVIVILNLFNSNGLLSQTTPGFHRNRDVEVSFNGTFIRQSKQAGRRRVSDNGVFSCWYRIDAVYDEMRTLSEFQLFQNDTLVYTLPDVPGSDVVISNSGLTAFMDHGCHFENILTIHFYSSTGEHLLSRSFEQAGLFEFSKEGNQFGVGTSGDFQVITFPEGKVQTFEKVMAFDINEREGLAAAAIPEKIRVFQGGALLLEVNSEMELPRRIRLSPDGQAVALMDKHTLRVYEIRSGQLLLEDHVNGSYSYRDLSYESDRILAGIHDRTKDTSRGILRTYKMEYGEYFLEEETEEAVRSIPGTEFFQKSSTDYEAIPWPFFPYDSLHTVWNYYEQHNWSYSNDFSYLHQGLDIITPVAEPTYAVAPGIVKLVLTIGGYVYWRIATSKEQVAGTSRGWLYAHLIPESIQFSIGDSVEIHDYLGDIVQWSEDWGHIHFVEIEDQGLIWYYSDDQWGITFNPLLVLQPDTDIHPPFIEPFTETSKFGICRNESSSYMEPDSVYGDIDIIVKMHDTIGDSPWYLPAFETFYWIRRISDYELIFPRMMGHRLNHAYDFYSSSNYGPYALVIYKKDYRCPPTFWMEEKRDYYMVLTNSDGDSLIDLSEKNLAFSTTDYPDDHYRIYVEVLDAYGNSTLDSMDVRFKNGISTVEEPGIIPPETPRLYPNFPNPFNSSTTIRFRIPQKNTVILTVLDTRGRIVTTLINETLEPGEYTVLFNAVNIPSGRYIYQLEAGKHVRTGSMTLIK